MAASGCRSVPDNSFEFTLERLYADVPRRPDSDLFTALVRWGGSIAAGPRAGC